MHGQQNITILSVYLKQPSQYAEL